MFKNHDFLCEMVAEQMADRLLDITKPFDTGVITGTERIPQPKLQEIRKNSEVANFYASDLIPGCVDIVLAEEELPFGKNSLDFIGSFLTLHTANDLPGALIQINYALKPDGLFLGTMFGGETLYELRHVLMQTETQLKGGVAPRVMPFADKQQMGALLQRAGFALPVVDSDIVEVTYDKLTDLLYDLRGMGESNVVSERPSTCPGKSFFKDAEAFYRDQFVDEKGRLKASFEVIYLIGWAPHANQQQPLRPGSADLSLAKALGTEEHDTGVPTGQNKKLK